jgi:membrane protease YdiL (CAAX protease family)
LTAAVFVLLGSYFVSMVLGPVLFYISPQGVDAASRIVTDLPLSFFMIANLSIPFGAHAGVLFLAIWLLYVAAFALAWRDVPSFPVSVKSVAPRLSSTRSNYLVLLPQVSTILLVAVVLLQTLQESAGVQTGGISFQNPVLGFLSVSYAPLVEELSFRITTIGFLDGLHLVWKTRQHLQFQGMKGAIRLLASGMWKPDETKRQLGFRTIRNDGLKGISRLEWVTLAVTSGAFGAAHFLYGGGWEIGKISTAMISGLALGLVYLRYGAYAPILLHWFFNYYFGAFDLASQLRMPGADILGSAVEFLNLGVGILLGAVLVLTCLARLWAARHPRSHVPAELIGDPPNV